MFEVYDKVSTLNGSAVYRVIRVYPDSLSVAIQSENGTRYVVPINTLRKVA